jgi:hypothetical protein
LTVEIDSLFSNQIVNVLHQPVPRLRISQVKQLVFSLGSQQPLGAVLVKPRIWRNALRFKPNDRLESLLVSVLADGPESMGEPLRVYFPGSGVIPMRLEDVQPASIHQ